MKINNDTNLICPLCFKRKFWVKILSQRKILFCEYCNHWIDITDPPSYGKQIFKMNR